MTFDAEQKATLQNGAPVINCHIQNGANLAPEAVQQSLDNAKRFFKTLFPERRYQAFLCYSWLLYPPMTKQLSIQSNIKRFAERFSIIGFCDDAAQAKENLFEGEQRPTAENMTTLQKLAIDHIELFGFACGIIRI